MTKPKITYQAGWPDKSGRATIIAITNAAVGPAVMEPVAKTAWGCGCCEGKTTPKEIKMAEGIAQSLNVISTLPELLAAVEDYFETYANEPKRPQWAKRVIEAKHRLRKALAATKKVIK